MKTLLPTLAISLCLAALAVAADAPSTRPARKLKVAIYSDDGSPGSGLTNVSNCLAAMPDGFDFTKVTAQDIRDGKLAGIDVLVQPGGGGKAQATALEESGRTIIQDFVRDGHGFVGICAGAYLATNDYPWSLGFVNAKVLDKKHWARGPASEVKIHFTELGQQILGETPGVKGVIYHQGPILAPSTQPGMPAYDNLAIYDSEVVKADGGIPGLMVGATAMAATTYGNGRVIVIGPHPERSPGLEGVIRRSVQWVAPTTRPAS